MFRNFFRFFFVFFVFFIFASSFSFAQNAGDLTRQTKDYYDNGAYKKAFESAGRLLELNPNLRDAHYVYVKSSQQLGEPQLEECMKFYEGRCSSAKIYFWKKSTVGWFYGLGLTYAIMGKKDQAKSALNWCIKLDPKSPVVDDILKLASDSGITLDVPTKSFTEDVQTILIIVGVLIIMLVLWMSYKAFVERKVGERQAANIKKDRSVDHFGNLKKPKK